MQVAAHVEVPQVLPGLRIHRDQVAVIIGSEDETARGRHRSRPHPGRAGHGKFPLELTGEGIERPEIEVAGLSRRNSVAGTAEPAAGDGLLRGAVVDLALLQRYDVEQSE